MELKEAETLRIKVIGSKRSIEVFIKVLREVFPISVASPILKNDRDPQWHAFLNINPFVRGEIRDG